MRFRDLPREKPSQGQELGVSYDHIVFNRALIVWVHVVLGLVAALIYLSTMETTHFKWWGRSSGLIGLVFPTVVPYLVSGVFSRRRVTARRFGVWLFTLVLVAGTAAVGYFYLRTASDASGIFTAAFVQTAVYLFAAGVLLRGRV